MIDKFLIINQILIQLLCSPNYILWNLIYEILIHGIIEFPVLVDLVAWEHTVYPFIITSFIIRNLVFQKGMQETSLNGITHAGMVTWKKKSYCVWGLAI